MTETGTPPRRGPSWTTCNETTLPIAVSLQVVRRRSESWDRTTSTETCQSQCIWSCLTRSGPSSQLFGPCLTASGPAVAERDELAAWPPAVVLAGIMWIVPRRSRCTGCGVTHVLLPVLLLARRADTAAVIGAGLTAKATGAVYIGSGWGTRAGGLAGGRRMSSDSADGGSRGRSRFGKRWGQLHNLCDAPTSARPCARPEDAGRRNRGEQHQ